MKNAKKVLLLGVAMLCLAGCSKGSLSGGCGTDAGGVGSSESAVGESMLAPSVEDRVFFAFDSSALSAEAQSVLVRQAAWLQSQPSSVKIVIEGHCDEIGTREYNMALGERRAHAVKKFLEHQGVHQDRISVVSFGKERPVALGGTDEDRARNRRGVTVVNQVS